jgi:hypothetical protein
MKNIHILPTEKPSYLYKMSDNKLRLSDLLEKGSSAWINQHIYITSDEEIKEGDWFFNGEHILQCSDVTDIIIDTEGQWSTIEDCKKIILTTDQDLIADGVQAIDDEFLKWFVQNPSCEWVEVEKGYLGMCGFVKSSEPISKDKLHYKIIIPQEEPKQETLEEAAQKHLNEKYRGGGYLGNLFIAGAKWQAENMPIHILDVENTYVHIKDGVIIVEKNDKTERMYSEEDMISFAIFYYTHQGKATEYWGKDLFKEWFEQFKKK